MTLGAVDSPPPADGCRAVIAVEAILAASLGCGVPHGRGGRSASPVSPSTGFMLSPPRSAGWRRAAVGIVPSDGDADAGTGAETDGDAAPDAAAPGSTSILQADTATS